MTYMIGAHDLQTLRVWALRPEVAANKTEFYWVNSAILVQIVLESTKQNLGKILSNPLGCSGPIAGQPFGLHTCT